MKTLRVLTIAILVTGLLGSSLTRARAEEADGASPQASQRLPVAGLVADWFPRSHPDVILARLLKTHTLDGKGEPSPLKLVSLYRDRPTERDMGQELAKQYGLKVCDSTAEALTLGTDKLQVDGVLLSTEWAPYPESPTGQTMYPHRQMFEQIIEVYKASGRVAPVFIDKHLADTWEDSKWIYDTAEQMKIPLMAGSSLPVAWRHPAVDVHDEKPLKQIVGISYHTLDTYGFHGVETVQCLAEKRKGGETGIKAVQCLTGQAVWDAAGDLYDPQLLERALGHVTWPPRPKDKPIQQLVKKPVLFVMDYVDGLRVCVFTLNPAVAQWTAAWKYDDGEVVSTQFWLQQDPPYGHFSRQTKGVEQMIVTGKPAWPVERTLMTSGALNALLRSKLQDGKRLATPFLEFGYDDDWTWQAPPPAVATGTGGG